MKHIFTFKALQGFFYIYSLCLCVNATTPSVYEKPSCKDYIKFTAIGACATDCRKFLDFYTDSNNSSTKLEKNLGYAYKQEQNKLSAICCNGFLVDDKDTLFFESFKFAKIIENAYSKTQSTHVEILTPFYASYNGIRHAQYMQIDCFKDNQKNIKVYIKLANSTKHNKRKAQNNEKIKSVFNNPCFKKLNINLVDVAHYNLGVQDIISLDCNAFAQAYLYIKWAKGVNPEDVKNYKLLYETMKYLLELKIIYKVKITTIEITKKGWVSAFMSTITTPFFKVTEFTSKLIGDSLRNELENPSSGVVHKIKQFFYRALEKTLRFLVGSSLYIFSKILS